MLDRIPVSVGLSRSRIEILTLPEPAAPYLSIRQAEAVRMALEGDGISRIAVRMGVSEDMVKAHLKMARKKYRKAADGDGRKGKDSDSQPA